MAKAQELAKLCRWLRKDHVDFYAVSRGRRGHPDLVVIRGEALPIAVWLRRADRRAAEMTEEQSAQIEKVASRGWATLVAFGAQEALQELHRRGIASGKGIPYAVAASSY